MEAVNAALTPRFTPLRPDLGDTASFSAPDADASAPAAEQAAGSDSTDGEAGAAEPDRLPAFGTSMAAAGPGPDVPMDDMEMPSFRTEAGPGQRGVIVPPAVNLGEDNRLPIFESVESDWFRRGRHGADRPVPVGSAAVTTDWTSPADAGWEAAEVASAPVSGGTTMAGLPKRVPKANLVPGGVSGTSPVQSAPARSAAQTRDRLASFQRGVREGRAAAESGEVPDNEEGDGAP
jgi:hypothetical protein